MKNKIKIIKHPEKNIERSKRYLYQVALLLFLAGYMADYYSLKNALLQVIIVNK